jgi:hypothetical protein
MMHWGGIEGASRKLADHSGAYMNSAVTDLGSRVSALMPRAHDDLAALVACQSVADVHQFPASECLKAAQLVIDDFAGAGLRGMRLEQTPDAGTGAGEPAGAARHGRQARPGRACRAPSGGHALACESGD